MGNQKSLKDNADLSPQACSVLWEEGTEAPFTSGIYTESRDGAYVCANCGAELFSSKAKYESGTGWPSFFESITQNIATKVDRKHGMERVEYHCAKCGGHQGHIFDDGPLPTGKRFCNNGVALRFVPKEQTKT